jgi:hypothetical protein
MFLSLLPAVLLPRGQAEVHGQWVLPCSEGVRPDLLQVGIHVCRRRVQGAQEVRHEGELEHAGCTVGAAASSAAKVFSGCQF